MELENGSKLLTGTVFNCQFLFWENTPKVLMPAPCFTLAVQGKSLNLLHLNMCVIIGKHLVSSKQRTFLRKTSEHLEISV